MRILLATHQYFPEHIGGTEVFTHGIAKRLKENNEEVAVVTYIQSTSGNKEDYAVKKIEYEGIPVYQIHYNLSVDPVPVKAEYDNEFVKEQFISILHEVKPALVHFTHAMKISGSVMEACSSLGIPFVVTLTDFWFICPRHTLLKWNNKLCGGPKNKTYCARCMHKTHGFFNPAVMKYNSFLLACLLKFRKTFRIGGNNRFWNDLDVLSRRNEYLLAQIIKAEYIMVLSGFQKKMFLKNGYPDESIRVLRHGPEITSRTTEIKTPHGTDINLLLIGSIVPHKGVHIAIEAITRCKNPDLRLLIYGDYSGNDHYMKMIRDAAAKEPRINLMGTFPPSETGNILAEGDVLIMPSLWYENLPLVIQLALSQGIPVIASNSGSLPEIISHDENGWLIARGDIKAWTETFNKLSLEKLGKLRVNPGSIGTMDENFKDIYSIYKHILK